MPIAPLGEFERRARERPTGSEQVPEPGTPPESRPVYPALYKQPVNLGSVPQGNMVAVEPYENETLQNEGLLDLPPEEVERIKAKGKIGYIEALDKGFPIPFDPRPMVRYGKILNAVNRVRDDNYDSDEAKQKDIKAVNDFLYQIEEERIRGYSLLGNIGRAHVEIPKFIIEFAASGGLASISKYGLKKGAKEVTEKVVEKGAINITRKSVLKLAKEGAVRSGYYTVIGGFDIAANYRQRQIMANFGWTEDGVKLLETAKEKPYTTLAKVIGTRYIEGYSETTGPILRRGVGAIGSKIPVKFYKPFFDAYMKLNGTKGGSKLVKLFQYGTGFDGVLEELGEERVGSLLHALAGTQRFSADTKPGQIFDELGDAIFPDKEQLLIEIGAIAPLTGANYTVNQLSKFISDSKRAGNPDYTGEPNVRDISPEEIDQLIKETTEAEKAEVESLKQEARKPVERFMLKPDIAALQRGEKIEAKPAVETNLEAMAEAEASLADLGYSTDIISEIENTGLPVEDIEKTIIAAEEIIEEGQSPAAAFRAAFGEQVSDTTIDKLALEYDQQTAGPPGEAEQAPLGVKIKFPDTQESIVLAKEDFDALDRFNQFYAEFKTANKNSPNLKDIQEGTGLSQEEAGRLMKRLTDFGLVSSREIEGQATYQAIPYEEIEQAPVEYVPTDEELSQARDAILDQPFGASTEGVSLPKTVVYEEARKLWAEEIEPIAALEEFASRRLSSKDVPKRFRASKGLGISTDQLAEEGIQMGLLPEGTTGADLTTLLSELGDQKRRPRVAEFLDEALQNSREQRERFARVQRDLKSRIVRTQNIGRVADQPTITEYRALSNQLRSAERAAAISRKFTQDEIKGIQKILRKAVKAMPNLTPAQRDTLTGRIINTQTPEQAQRIIPEIQARVNQLIEKATKSSLTAAIRKELKTVKPKVSKGKQTGKFTPEIQKSLTLMREASKMTSLQALEKLGENLNVYNSVDNPIPPVEIAHQNMILDALVNRDTVSVARLREILGTVQALKEGGRQAAKLKEFKRLADDDQRAKSVSAIVNSRYKDSVIEGSGVLALKNRNPAQEWYNRATGWLLGWDNIMNRISWGDKTTGTNQSIINQIADVFKEETEEKKLNRISKELHDDAWAEAYGEMSDFQKEKKLAVDSKIELIGEFRNARGVVKPLYFSRQQAIKFWQELQDPTLHNRIYGVDSMAFTEEMVNAVTQTLTDADKLYAQRLMEFYKVTYRRFNEKYREMYGVDLPQLENYSPVSAEPVELTEEETQNLTADQIALPPTQDRYDINEMLDEAVFRLSVLPSAGKMRTKTRLGLKRQNVTETFFRHHQQVDHFIAWSDKISILSSLFNDVRVRNAIKRNFGDSTMRLIDRHLQDFTRGGLDRSHDSEFFNWLKNNYVVSVLAGKVAIMAKQLVSFPAFADNMPTKDFIAGLIDFGTNTKAKIELLRQSEVLRARGAGFSPELAEAITSNDYRRFSVSPTWKNTLTVLTRIGDRGAILFGGWAVYRYNRTVLNKSHAEAMEAFERSFESSQQSPSLSQQSLSQRGNTFIRLWTIFRSAQQQYLRKSIAAAEDYVAGRISAKEAAKKMVIYNVILPLMFQVVSDGFKINPKNIIRAVAATSAAGIPVFSTMIDAVVSTALGIKAFTAQTIADSLMRSLLQAVKEFDDDDFFTLEGILDAIKELSEFGGLVTGAPIQQVYNTFGGVRDMIEAENAEDMSNGFKRVAGWSEFVLNTNENPKSKKPALSPFSSRAGSGKKGSPLD